MRVLSLLALLTLLLPMVGWAEDMIDPRSLVGEHPCKGRNPDGSEYEGTVSIKVKGELVLLAWNIKGEQQYGTGVIVGMNLGVGLENGVALYKIYPQAEGKSLIGLWATQGAKTASEEVILIDSPDMESAECEVIALNGKYRAERGASDDQSLTISGGDTVKKITIQDGDLTAQAEGLQLGDGIAIITPTGLALYEIEPGAKRMVGKFVDGKGNVTPISLKRIK